MNIPRFLSLILMTAALAVPAAAQDGGFLDQMGEPIDTSAPIDIAADALEVIQAEQVAIFSGNVDATQGELRLQASELRVHYDSGEGTGGEISRLDANGNVNVSSPRETASGDWAIYNVVEELVTMGGNVILTQGENVIQGDRLTINLATGRSLIEGGVTGTVQGGNSTEESGGRVRGRFTIPRNDDAEEDVAEDESADTAAAENGTTETDPDATEEPSGTAETPRPESEQTEPETDDAE